ncbi:hypothetical protein KM043_005320 [Ampulex compressa]|nr:hypothetical protein KM043_005320 [Ampulex compressa]
MYTFSSKNQPQLREVILASIVEPIQCPEVSSPSIHMFQETCEKSRRGIKEKRDTDTRQSALRESQANKVHACQIGHRSSVKEVFLKPERDSKGGEKTAIRSHD